jgi:hypothetical protein
MESSTRTVYGVRVQTCLELNIPMEYPANSTLNEKFGIQASTIPAATDRPYLGGYVIGNKGHTLVLGAEGVAKPSPVQHSATDAALYGHLPFVLRPVNNDLTSTERAKYVLRKEEVHNGQTYAAYYLRRIDLSAVTSVMETKTVTNGVEQVTPFVPNSSNLNPTPPVVNNQGVNVVDGTYVTAHAKLSLSMTQWEIDELKNVGLVLYNDSGFAIISEIGLCTFVDKTVQVTASGGGTFNFKEAIGCQIASHIPALVPADFSNTGVIQELKVGATEPLFSLQQA